MTDTPDVDPLSRWEIEVLAVQWYRMLDEHAVPDEITALVADDLEYVVPEATVRGREELAQWCVGGGRHPGVYNVFFDESHNILALDTTWQDDRARVNVIVNWQARRWRPPAPRSEWIGFDVTQRWEVLRSPSTGAPVIQRYVVDELRPMAGSPPL